MENFVHLSKNISNENIMKINRKDSIKALITSILSFPLMAKNVDKNLQIDAKADLIASFRNSEKYTVTVFNQMPEEKLDWKYTPESMSFRTQFVHCITFTASQLCGRMDIINPNDTKKKEYWEKLTKVELEAELHVFYNWLVKIAEETTTENLTKKEQFVAGDTPIWKILYSMENHIIHHRGQAICYLRLNGITPVGYIGWF
jgi:uncharacterized damage-inducible protein DinB